MNIFYSLFKELLIAEENIDRDSGTVNTTELMNRVKSDHKFFKEIVFLFVNTRVKRIILYLNIQNQNPLNSFPQNDLQFSLMEI